MEAKEFDFVPFIPKEAKGIGVAIILIKPNGGIYLTKRINSGKFGCPGGKVDENDFSLKSAMRRELLEETGLKIEEERLHWIGYQKVTTDSTEYTCWYLLVLNDNEIPINKEPTKHTEWALYKLNETRNLPLFCGTGPVFKLLNGKLKERISMYRDVNMAEELKKFFR